jgi:hypothetical protein
VAARYRRARSTNGIVSVLREALGATDGEGVIGVVENAVAWYRFGVEWSATTSCGGSYFWLKNPGNRVICATEVAAMSVPSSRERCF